jgi:hypothetical protein
MAQSGLVWYRKLGIVDLFLVERDCDVWFCKLAGRPTDEITNTNNADNLEISLCYHQPASTSHIQ